MYHRYTRALICTLIVTGIVGCSSSGAGTPSPERTAALAAFAGTWRFDEAGTAQAAGFSGTLARDIMHDRASEIGAEILRPGAGGDAISGTPAGLRQTMLMLGITAEAMTLSPAGDGTVSVTFDSEEAIQVPVEGDWIDASAPQGPIEVRLRWRGDALAIERRIPGGGTIRDSCSILESGHLLLTREIVWRRAQLVGRIVYDR